MCVAVVALEAGLAAIFTILNMNVCMYVYDIDDDYDSLHTTTKNTQNK